MPDTVSGLYGHIEGEDRAKDLFQLFLTTVPQIGATVAVRARYGQIGAAPVSNLTVKAVHHDEHGRTIVTFV